MGQIAQLALVTGWTPTQIEAMGEDWFDLMVTALEWQQEQRQRR